MRAKDRHRSRKILPTPSRPEPTHCEICGNLPKAPKVGSSLDHCHLTDKFRGWLYSACNLGLGVFQDNPKALVAAASYLRKAYCR